MIEPPPAAAIDAPNRADSRNGPLKFTDITLSNNSSDTSVSDGYSGDIPALFTSTSQRSNSA